MLCGLYAIMQLHCQKAFSILSTATVTSGTTICNALNAGEKVEYMIHSMHC